MSEIKTMSQFLEEISATILQLDASIQALQGILNKRKSPEPYDGSETEDELDPQPIKRQTSCSFE